MEELGMITGTAVCLTNTATQTNEKLQVVNLVITCVVGVVTLAYTIYKWYLKAKQDGKITPDEIGDLVEDVKEEITDLSREKDKDE